MADNFLGEAKVARNPSIWEQIKEHVGKYGWFALILAFFTAWNAFIIWNAEKFMARADQQAVANEKIGILEGKMEMLLRDKNNQITPTSTLSPSQTVDPAQ